MSSVIPYGRQEITDEDIQAVVSTLKSDFLTQGPAVAQFENAFAKFVGAKYAVAVNNATSALHLCALALGVRPGQKVLCTPNTFVASSNCILYCGGDVEFVDIELNNFCLDLDLLEKKLSSAPKGTYAGVVAVDFAGYPMDFRRLRKIADQYGLWLIEDACHAPGADFQTSDGQWHRSGSGEFADLSVFSFHPVKHIATAEGGMITTNSQKLYDQIKYLRTHGITKDPKELTRNDGGWYYEMQSLGMNYRLPDILCALGSSQLERIEKNLQRRRQIASKYAQAFHGLPIQCPNSESTIRHAHHLYVIQTDRRTELYNFLKSQGVYCQVHYIPIYQQPYYIEKYGKISLPQMDKYYSKALSLPMFHAMTDSEQDFVIAQVKNFFQSATLSKESTP
ncbi:MAG: UDP-4-amino-4,6-dideoxy-N-acetyl-beta-L-altrosamine transaminase [Bdellovibrio sp. CG10_big_fil_rev_8_21_14_0_10_47_8]|nr:MAG: UDP-4-amino-4,6-dideoxy-N-acetyl-beta-L-altrosamine transaminase [Bdellovibrio sp. CG10_big_fil_rev_8_21_14_0_10_47_8]